MTYDGPKTTVTPPSNAATNQPALAATTTTTDFAGRTTTSVKAGLTTSYTYDRHGYLTTLKVPTSPTAWTTSTYGYDFLGRRLTTTDPDAAPAAAGGSLTDYWPGGQIKHTHDASGKDIYTTIDALGRPLNTYAGTSASGPLLTANTYDGIPLGGTTALKGTLTSATAYVGSVAGTNGAPYTTRYGYDTRYRTTRVDETLPTASGTTTVGAPGGTGSGNGAGGSLAGISGTWTSTSTYDGADRLLTHTYPAAGGLPAETTTTAYSTTSPAFPAGTTSPVAGYVTASAYTGAGQVSSRTLGAAGATGSVLRSYTWDPSTLRMTSMTAATPSNAASNNVQNDAITYTPSGQVTSVTDTVGAQRECYTYDTRNRLTAAVTTGTLTAGVGSTSAGGNCTADATGPTPFSEAYTYDDAANMLTRAHTTPGIGTVTTTYTHDDITLTGPNAGTYTGGPHAPTSTTAAGTGTGTGDTAGYSWDGAGRLTTRKATTGAGLTTTTTYTWDTLGRLVAVTDTGGSTTTEGMIYGPSGSRLLRTTPTETVAYLTDGTELHQPAPVPAGSAPLPANTRAVRPYTHVGVAVAVRATTGPAGINGGNGTLTWTLGDRQGSAAISVDAGTGVATRDRYLPYGGNRATTWTAPTDKGWLAQTRDVATGLDYLNARYYNPDLTHFLATDPLVDSASPQRANPYTYAADNPTTFTDPTGLKLPCQDDGTCTVGLNRQVTYPYPEPGSTPVCGLPGHCGTSMSTPASSNGAGSSAAPSSEPKGSPSGAGQGQRLCGRWACPRSPSSGPSTPKGDSPAGGLFGYLHDHFWESLSVAVAVGCVVVAAVVCLAAGAIYAGTHLIYNLHDANSLADGASWKSFAFDSVGVAGGGFLARGGGWLAKGGSHVQSFGEFVRSSPIVMANAAGRHSVGKVLQIASTGRNLAWNGSISAGFYFGSQLANAEDQRG